MPGICGAKVQLRYQEHIVPLKRPALQIAPDCRVFVPADYGNITRILFCKISSMKYYKGHCDEDVPVNGGKYVAEHGYGHEEYNL